MQQQITTQRQSTIPTSLLDMPVETNFEYPALDKMLIKEPSVSMDVLALKYLSATVDLNEIMEEHHTLLKDQPTILLLCQKLLEIFKEAAGGSYQALIDANNAGEKTLLGILDILEDIGIIAETAGERNIYAQLEVQFTELHEQYVETPICMANS